MKLRILNLLLLAVILIVGASAFASQHPSPKTVEIPRGRAILAEWITVDEAGQLTETHLAWVKDTGDSFHIAGDAGGKALRIVEIVGNRYTESYDGWTASWELLSDDELMLGEVIDDAGLSIADSSAHFSFLEGGELIEAEVSFGDVVVRSLIDSKTSLPLERRLIEASTGRVLSSDTFTSVRVLTHADLPRPGWSFERRGQETHTQLTADEVIAELTMSHYTLGERHQSLALHQRFLTIIEDDFVGHQVISAFYQLEGTTGEGFPPLQIRVSAQTGLHRGPAEIASNTVLDDGSGLSLTEFVHNGNLIQVYYDASVVHDTEAIVAQLIDSAG